MISQEESHQVESTLEPCRVCCPSLSVDSLCKLFGISMRERFVYSAPFSHFFNHLFLSVHTCGYLFQTLSYNPIQFYFFYCSNCYSFGPWEIFQKTIILSVSVCVYLCTHTLPLSFSVCVCLYM